jgi:DNA-binding MltR family transcriptional regulator
MELTSQTDRGVAIVGAALLETRLEISLRACFVPALTESATKAVLRGNLSAKAQLAHALGVIGKDSLSDLDFIRQVRNKFAHDLAIRSFDEPEISGWCSKLRLADMDFMPELRSTEPRARFLRSVLSVAHFMYAEAVAGTRVGEPPSKSPS